MKLSIRLVLTCVIAISRALGHDMPPSGGSAKIVLIAGEKSHPAGTHEYIKTVRLIKTMLDKSNIRHLKTEVHLHGWPEDERTLDDADLILFVSDGCDGYNFGHVPFMSPERMRIMERQVNRGCGISLIHFSTFADYSYGQIMLKWTGGYFDWQDSGGKRRQYSQLKETDAVVHPSPGTEISNGVRPFRLKDEFYYDIRFADIAPFAHAAAEVPALGSKNKDGNVIAWSLQRNDGGRAFCTTMSHYYANWENDDFRKLLLNGIVWAAGLQVPESGVAARYYTDAEVIKHVYGKQIKVLMLADTAEHGHWKNSAGLIREAIIKDKKILLDISSGVNDLWQYDLRDYQFVIICKEDTAGINSYSKKELEVFLKEGGGLFSIPFKVKDPDAAAAGAAWPEYASIFRHEQTCSYRLRPVKIRLGVRKEIAPLPGNDPLVVARELVSDTVSRPVAWTYRYGRGRIFQTVITDNPASLRSGEGKRLIRKTLAWLSQP